MQLLVLAIVFLQSTVWLPFVRGDGPRTVIPVVVEANTMSSVSIDPQTPHACFDELSPAAVVASAAICPIPGRNYPVLSGGGSIALVGYAGDARRLAWGGSSDYTIRNPSAVIADAQTIVLGDSIVTDDTTAGPIVTSGPYTLIILPFDGVTAAGVEQDPPFFEKVDFGKYLWEVVRGGTQFNVNLDRTLQWYDSTGLIPTTAVALGCGSGDFIRWRPTGPATWVGTGTGQVRVIFKGQFTDPADQFCMAPFVWVEVGRLMAVPGLKAEVDRRRGASSATRWTWDIGDGLARTFAWTGFDYLSFFAIRSSGSGVPATNSFFLLVPTDFLRLDCVFLSGRKVCSLEQEPGL